ncbi:putative Yippee-type zinc-binding protein [Dioscorea alata]|uniref:Yippee-type zinc-binding protein n=1 Tax=Dioscorea alata TaxID=55571 RepID=A0ACB7VN78_DIOAL|nr:putative Yippee-type zinc-binding protein [Dioscorea alata]
MRVLELERFSSVEMGRIFIVELDGKLYRCRVCGTHLALAEDLISKAFYCRPGKAFLFSNVSNVSFGDQEERVMLSGMHTVVDLFCCSCGQNVGWKYESAREKTLKYEGKFVLERRKIDDGPDSHYYIDTAHPVDHNENMYIDDDN